MAMSKGSSKGYSMGKGKVHWSSPFIYSSSWNPYPIPMVLEIVEAIGYSWDEYCDKLSKADLKVGDHRAVTFCCGALATPPQGPKASGLRPFYGSTCKGSPSIGKGQSKILMVSLCSLSSPEWPVLISSPWATPPIKSQQMQFFQWQPPPLVFFRGVGAPAVPTVADKPSALIWQVA